MSDMPEKIWAGHPKNGKTKVGAYSYSPVPLDAKGRPSTRKYNPRTGYVRNDLYEALQRENERLKAECDNLFRENLKYEERHKAWENQVYVCNKTSFMAVRETELGDPVKPIPIATITDLLDRNEALQQRNRELAAAGDDLFAALYELKKAYGGFQKFFGLKEEDSPLFRAAGKAGKKWAVTTKQVLEENDDRQD